MPKIVTVLSLLCLFLSSLFAAKAKKENVPVWVQDPSLVYFSSEYLNSLGQGKSQKEADADALAGLVAIFNRSIASNTKSSLEYSSQSSGTHSQIAQSKKLKQDVSISTNMDDLIGAEIRERWKSPDGTFYSLAVIEKDKGARLYREKASACISDIDNLVASNDGTTNTFSAYFRCLKACQKAQRLQVYKGCLSVLESSAASLIARHPDSDYSPLALELKASEIAKAIEIYVEASPEAKKLKAHVENVFSKHNFTLAKDSSARYKLAIELELDDLVHLSGGRISMRYNLTIELLDSLAGKTVLSLPFEGKETQFEEGALKSKILKTLEKKAINEFASSFKRFASGDK